MQLVDQGKLDLDAPMRNKAPDPPITDEMLLRLTSNTILGSSHEYVNEDRAPVEFTPWGGTRNAPELRRIAPRPLLLDEVHWRQRPTRPDPSQSLRRNDPL